MFCRESSEICSVFSLFFQRVKTILSCICQQNVFAYIRYIFPRKQFDFLLVLAIKFCFWDPEIKLLTCLSLYQIVQKPTETNKDTHRHIDPKIHTHTHTHTYTHTHTQIHTLGSVLVYTFILGTLYIQICLSKKRKNNATFYSPFFMLASVISEIDDLCYSVVHLS